MNSSSDLCTKPSCKNTIPDDDINIRGDKYKKCKSCRDRDATNTAARRKRKREEATEPTPQQAPSVHQNGSYQQASTSRPGQISKDTSESDASMESFDEDKTDNVSFNQPKKTK